MLASSLVCEPPPREDFQARASRTLHRVCRDGGTLFTSMNPGDEGRAEHTYGYGTDTGRFFVTHEPEPFTARLRVAGFSVETVEREEQWHTVFARA